MTDRSTDFSAPSYTAPQEPPFQPTSTPTIEHPPVPKVQPSWLYITRDDRLRIRSMNGFANLLIRVRGRVMGLDGQVRAFAQQINTGALRTSQDFFLDLNEGWLLSVYVEAPDNLPAPGQLYVSVFLHRGLAADANPVELLCAGYIQTNYGLGWPFPKTVLPVGDIGQVQLIALGAGGVGADITFSTPGNVLDLLLDGAFTFVASAAAGNRIVRFILDYGAGTNVIGQFPANAVITAGQTVVLSLTNAPTNLTDAATVHVPMPLPFKMTTNMRLRTGTTNLQAGDQFTVNNLHLERFLTG